MANLKISQFTTLATSAQSPGYLLPLADAGVTNYAMTLNSIFSNIGANTTTGQVISTTTGTGAAVSNLGILVTRGDGKRSVAALITSDAAPAPQLLLKSEIVTAQGDNINRITFLKSNQGGGQAPASATLGTIRFCTDTETIVAAEAVVASVQSSGGYGNTFCYYSTRSGTVSTAGIFAVDNWGTFRVGRNLSNTFADIQLSDPTKLFMLGAADNLNDSTNTALHIRGTADTMKNLVLQSRASQSVNVFEHRSSANALLLQISPSGLFSPGTAAAVDLATSALPFKDLYLAGSSGTPGTNNFRVTGTATAARVITLPDATCTLTASASALTSGRVPFVTTGGLLTDTSTFLFDGTDLKLGQTGAAAARLHLIDNVAGQVFRLDGTTTTGFMQFYVGSGSLARALLGYGNSGNIFTGALTQSFAIRAENALHLGAGGNNLVVTIGTDTNVAVGTTVTSLAKFTLLTGSASKVGIVVQGAASQSANLTEWQNSAGTVLSGIDASGRIYAPTALTATTVGAAGAASALPATPTGYLLINVNGTQKKIPYYDD